MNRIIVLISNYGVTQLEYCKKLIYELSQITGYEITIKIFSSNQNSFEGHEEIIVNNYLGSDFSLGIYDYLNNNIDYIKSNFDYVLLTENDMIFNQKNFDTYFKYETKIENDDYTIGFLRYENKNNEKYLIDLHYHFSVNLTTNDGIIDIINNSMISFENPHQGCFMIRTNQFYQISKQINIGKCLEDKVSKIYFSRNNIGSQNGIKRYVPLEDVDNLLIHHQPDKYVNLFTKITNLNELKNGTFLSRH